MEPAHGKQAFFLGKPIQTTPNWQKLREEGRAKLSAKAQLKFEWIIYYHTQGRKNVTKTSEQFGISRKTFHKWLNRFEKDHFQGLEEISKTPHTKRKRTISRGQELRIVRLRQKYLRSGKMNLKKRYENMYQESISSWHIQKVIEEKGLYYDKKKIQRTKKKQKQAQLQHKKRITTLLKHPLPHFLWHVDTVVFTLKEGGYRYLLTAIDEVSKLAYARLYTTHTSRNAADFLKRLTYLTENQVVNIHHDNGSEFAKEFELACKQYAIEQWYSRPRTPKDNPVLERFNRTIQEEFVELAEVDVAETDLCNDLLLDWLIDYNAHRPHQTLDYLSPLQYLEKHHNQVLPMSPSYTQT